MTEVGSHLPVVDGVQQCGVEAIAADRKQDVARVGAVALEGHRSVAAVQHAAAHGYCLLPQHLRQADSVEGVEAASRQREIDRAALVLAVAPEIVAPLVERHHVTRVVQAHRGERTRQPATDDHNAAGHRQCAGASENRTDRWAGSAATSRRRTMSPGRTRSAGATGTSATTAAARNCTRATPSMMSVTPDVNSAPIDGSRVTASSRSLIDRSSSRWRCCARLMMCGSPSSADDVHSGTAVPAQCERTISLTKRSAVRRSGAVACAYDAAIAECSWSGGSAPRNAR